MEALRLTAVDGPRGIRIKPNRTTRVRHLIDTRMGLASDTESRASGGTEYTTNRAVGTCAHDVNSIILISAVVGGFVQA
jgi:hypothetical protein